MSMRSTAATGYAPAEPSFAAVTRLTTRAERSTIARTTAASSRWRSVIPATGCRLHALSTQTSGRAAPRARRDRGAPGAPPVARLGPGAGPRLRMQAAADDVDGEARMVGEGD